MLSDHRILNPGLLAALSGLGHTDLVVVADAGLPLPRGVEVIDLSLVAGVPSFEQTLTVVLNSLVVESACIAEESAGHIVDDTFRTLLRDVPLRRVSHAELKSMCAAARLVIRTGECSPFANAVLTAGVPF